MGILQVSVELWLNEVCDTVSTHYSDTDSHANSVIDLIFLDMSSAQISHRIEPDLRLPSDHAPLLVDLPILPENIHLR